MAATQEIGYIKDESSHAAFLKHFKLSDLLHERKDEQALVTIDRTKKVSEALDLLKKHNIISIPVVDDKVSADKDEHFVGIVNVVDVVTVTVFQPVFNTYDTDIELEELSKDKFSRIQKLAVFDNAVEDIIGVSAESKRLWMYKPTDSIEELCNAFSQGVHRVLIRRADDKNHAVTVVSQTDVLRFLQTHKADKELAPIMQKPLKDCGLPGACLQQHLVAIGSSSTALTAFRRMMAHNETSAVPVVHAKVVLIANISASDLRGLTQANINNILLPVLDFLKAMSSSGQVKKPVTVTADTKLSELVDTLLENKMHRAWVVNHMNQPIGVITLTDVITLFSMFGKGQ